MIGNFQAVRDFVIIRADSKKNATKDIGNGVKLIIDTRWNPTDIDYVTQDGIVESIPTKVTGNPEITINVGDHVYTHHFLTNEENVMDMLGEDMFRIGYNDIYCRIVDGEIVMVGDWNFCEPIFEKEGVEFDPVTGKMIQKSESGLIINTDIKHDTKKCVVTHISKSLSEMGVKPGDTVYYREDCDYEMIVEGKKYFRVRTKDVLMFEENGQKQTK